MPTPAKWARREDGLVDVEKETASENSPENGLAPLYRKSAKSDSKSGKYFVFMKNYIEL